MKIGNRNKYSFMTFEVDEERVIEGEYVRIRVAANTFGRANKKMFLVKQHSAGISVTRYK